MVGKVAELYPSEAFQLLVSKLHSNIMLEFCEDKLFFL